MAKGFQKNREHKDKVALLGKSLIRRSGKKCELCSASGVSLMVAEVDPAPAVPDEDHAIMVCGRCQTVMGADKPDAGELRFLESVIWSEIPAVQVSAVRICQKLAKTGVDWAETLLETVYLSPEAEAWLQKE